MLRRLQRGALSGLRAAGIFNIVRRSPWRDRRLLILCYHGVSIHDEHVHHPELYISPETFTARLEALARGGYAVLPLGDALHRLQTGTLPPRSVCLTFDDGMFNFGAAALPLLERFGWAATVYLSTYYCVHDEPVFNPLCAYMLRSARGRVVDARTQLDVDQVWDLRTAQGVDQAFLSLRRVVDRERLGRAEQTTFARRVADILGANFSRLAARRMFHLLRPDQVKALAQRGIDFQLHTHRHRAPLNRELFLREIVENRAEMEAMLGTTPTHFCYPSGYWRPEFLPWLREAGVTSATTADPGLASRADNALLLPRVLDGEWLPQIEFEGWLTGTRAWLLPRRNGHGSA